MRALLGVLALTALAAAEAPLPRTVRVDVIATDSRGRAIPTLQPSDFELREDGAAQTIDEARFISIERSSSSAERLFAVFLDEYHVTADNTARVRSAMHRFVDDTLNPQDQVVVMRPLDSVFAISLTRDRDQIRQAIEQFEGRQGDYTPRSAYERNYVAGTPARVEQLRAQIATSALNALAVHLGSLSSDTRKTLVVISEGLPRPERRRGLEGLPTADTVIRSANRSNVSIYAVDPREVIVPAAVPPADADALHLLTGSTDGRSLGGGDLSAAMRPIADDSSAYYVLAYKTGLQKDGKFHEVQVGVRQAGVVVRTRKGYWSPISDDELRASLSRPTAPIVFEPARHISPYIQPWFGTARGKDGRTRVTFVWEPAGRLPGARQAPAARVVLKALAGDGTSLFEGVVLPTGPLHIQAGESQARAVFDAPPGVLRLRMSIESAAEQPIDSDVRDITIRDLSSPVALGTPAVLRARTARDFRALETDPDAVPAASREFSRTERLMIRVPGYAPADAPLKLSARLLNRSGNTMRDLAIRQEGAAAPTEGTIDLPLAGFAVGEYRIEFGAKSPAGEVKDLLVFRVTN